MDQPIHERAYQSPNEETVERATEQPLPPSSPLRLDTKRLVLLGILAAVTIALLLTLGDGPSALSTLALADWRYIALATLIHYSGFALRGHRWQLLLGTLGHRLSYLYTTSLLLAGWFVSALLPARAGDAFRVLALRMPPPTEPAIPVAPAIGTIVIERALDILAILILGAGFSVGVLQGRVPAWLLWTYALALALVVILAVILLATPLMLERLRPLIKHPLWHKTLDFVTQIADTLRQLAQHPRTAILTIGESLLIWLCDGLLLWLVVLSLGQPFTLSEASFVALSVDIFAAVPLTPGGMGQIETAHAALLALIAHPGLHIAAVVLATRAISYWSFLIFSGLVTLFAGFGRVFTASRS